MRFGLFLLFEWPGPERPFPAMYEELLEEIELAEALGIEVVWLAEHHFVNYSASPSPLLFAVKAAARTRRIRFGTGVLVLPFYHPLRLAGEVALADILTGGRLELGVGRGAYPYEFARHGVPFDQARERSQETLEVMLRLWTGEDVGHQGRFYSFPPTTVLPRPLQAPHPPIWIAALSPDSFAYGIRNGHHLMSTVFRDPLERVAEKIRLYHRLLAEADRPEADCQLGILRMAYVAETDALAMDVVPHVVRAHRTWYRLHHGTERVTGGIVEPSPVEDEPSPEEMFERLIIGDPARCLKQVRALEQVGVRLLLLNMNFGKMTHQEAMRSLRLFGTEVMPAFRS